MYLCLNNNINNKSGRTCSLSDVDMYEGGEEIEEVDLAEDDEESGTIKSFSFYETQFRLQM